MPFLGTVPVLKGLFVGLIATILSILVLKGGFEPTIRSPRATSALTHSATILLDDQIGSAAIIRGMSKVAASLTPIAETLELVDEGASLGLDDYRCVNWTSSIPRFANESQSRNVRRQHRGYVLTPHLEDHCPKA